MPSLDALVPEAPSFTGPRERTYRVTAPDGTALYVREMGQGPRLAVLHGGPGAHHDYLLPALARLADGFRLLFYDQRGGGRSRVPRPTDVSWRDHVNDLETLRREWGLERLPLLGYSWGALLALLYAVEHPERVRLLALVSPAAGWGDYHQRFQEEFERRSGSEAVQRMRERLETSGLRERDPEAYWQRRFELSVAAYFRDPEGARDLTPFRVQSQARAATWASLGDSGPELRRRLEGLEVSALIVHGRRDPMPLEYAEELAGLLPDARLVVLERSGHVPYVEEPDRLFPVLRRFLRKRLTG